MIIVTVKVFIAQLCLSLCDPMDCIAHQAPLSMEFSRQEYCSGLPFPPPGDLPDPGLESRSPALQADSFPSEPPGTVFHNCNPPFHNCKSLLPLPEKHYKLLEESLNFGLPLVRWHISGRSPGYWILCLRSYYKRHWLLCA